MNRLNIPNGGMPFEGDDLLFLQDSLSKPLNAVLRFLAVHFNGDCIIDGCVPTVNALNVSITEGWAIWGYELMYLPAQVISVDGTNDVVELIANFTFDPAGNELFADGQTKDTYEKRELQAIPRTAGTGVIGRISFGTVQDIIDAVRPTGPRIVEAIKPLTLPYYSIGVATIDQNNWSDVVGDAVEVFKDGNRKTIQGSIFGGTLSETTFTPVGTIPTGFRPTKSIKFAAPLLGAGIYGTAVVDISQSGLIQVLQTSSGSFDLINFCVTFW